MKVTPGWDDDDDDSAATSRRTAVRETVHVLEALSATWAGHGCPASGDCCQLRSTGRSPWLWPSEWWVLEASLAEQGRALPPAREDGGCPFLDASGRRCSVYGARPSGCRSYFCHRRTGPAVEPAQATHALLERLTKLNLGVDSEAAPKSLPEWHAAASARL